MKKEKYKEKLILVKISAIKMMDRQLSFQGDESGVIATNDDASESKRSCVKLGYYKDDYLHHFIKVADLRKAPEINRGYYARVKGIEICIEKFLKVSFISKFFF